MKFLGEGFQKSEHEQDRQTRMWSAERIITLYSHGKMLCC